MDGQTSTALGRWPAFAISLRRITERVRIVSVTPSAKRDASEDRAETTAVLEIEIVGLPDSEIIFATALAIGATLLGVRGRSLCSTTEPPPLVFQAD